MCIKMENWVIECRGCIWYFERFDEKTRSYSAFLIFASLRIFDGVEWTGHGILTTLFARLRDYCVSSLCLDHRVSIRGENWVIDCWDCILDIVSIFEMLIRRNWISSFSLLEHLCCSWTDWLFKKFVLCSLRRTFSAI